jgi:hypothetical protein
LIILGGLIVSNLLIYLHIRWAEKRSSRFTMTDLHKSKKAATQCFLYVFAYFLTWIWLFLAALIDIVIDPAGYLSGDYYWVVVGNHFFLPLQGLWNLLIYLRPTYLRLRGAGSTRCNALRQLFSKGEKARASSSEVTGSRRSGSVAALTVVGLSPRGSATADLPLPPRQEDEVSEEITPSSFFFICEKVEPSENGESFEDYNEGSVISA